MQKQKDLTPREQEIFDMLLNGISPKEIAFKLKITYYTVDFHRNKIYRKLGVKSIHEFLTKYGNGKNKVEDVQHSTFFERNRLKLLIPIGILLLIAAFFSGWYFAKKTSITVLPDEEGILVSLASVEDPLIITPYDNDPYGWHHFFNLSGFFGAKITEGDRYTIKFTVKSNVDFEALFFGLVDHTVSNNENEYGITFLLSSMPALGSVKANVEYSSTTRMIPYETASSTRPGANMFTLDVWPHIISQPVLTFTRFDIVKHK